jgi:hypothetical protein
MKNILFHFLLFCLFSQQVLGLGSSQEFGLGPRGELIVSSTPRTHDEIDFRAFLDLETSVIHHAFESDDEELVDMIEEVIIDYEQYDPIGSSEEDKTYLANRMRERLLHLRENHPDVFRNIQADRQRREGYDFSNEGLPAYCENFPSITGDDLEIFYSEAAGNPNDPICSRTVGEHIVHNDIGHVSEVMREIQNEALAPQLAEFRSEMMSEVAKGIFQQRGIYGGLEGNANSLYPACFSPSSEFNNESFQASLNESFNEARTAGSRDSASRESLIRSSIESMIYQEALRAYQEHALPPPPVTANPGVFHCRTKYALSEGISFEGVAMNPISNCHSNRIVVLYFQDNDQCVTAHNSLINGDRREEFETCVQENQNATTHTEAHTQVDQLLTSQIEETPLLFGRNRQGLGNDYISSMGRSIKSLPGMNDIIRNMVPHMQGGLLNFNNNFNALLGENNSQLESIYQAALANQELNGVIDNEIADYQQSLDNSLNEMCENGGENLHHIPELVETVRQNMVADASGESGREEALVRSQQVECHLLRENPPSDTGGLHPAVYYLGIAGGIALSFANPLVGGAVILAVEGANGYSAITTTQGQLEDILASAHAGFSSQERVIEARDARDGAVVDLVLTGAGEIVGVGIGDDILRGIRATTGGTDNATTTVIRGGDEATVATRAETPTGSNADQAPLNASTIQPSSFNNLRFSARISNHPEAEALLTGFNFDVVPDAFGEGQRMGAMNVSSRLEMKRKMEKYYESIGDEEALVRVRAAMRDRDAPNIYVQYDLEHPEFPDSVYIYMLRNGSASRTKDANLPIPGAGNFFLRKLAQEHPGKPFVSTMGYDNAAGFKNTFLEVAKNGIENVGPEQLTQMLQRIPTVRSFPGTVRFQPKFDEAGEIVDIYVLRVPDLNSNTTTIEGVDELLSDPNFNNWINSLPNRPEDYFNRENSLFN